MLMAWKLAFVGLFLGLAYRFRTPGIGQLIIAFLASFTLATYVCGLAGVLLLARISPEDYTWGILGLFLGGIAGLIAAIFLARAATRSPRLHWGLVFLAAALMLSLPPLI